MTKYVYFFGDGRSEGSLSWITIKLRLGFNTKMLSTTPSCSTKSPSNTRLKSQKLNRRRQSLLITTRGNELGRYLHKKSPDSVPNFPIHREPGYDTPS
jgi:hypothetical protein